MTNRHPNAERITGDFQAWAGAADADDERAPVDDERRRLWIELRQGSPMRSSTDQADANHLPLFVAANEPGLL